MVFGSPSDTRRVSDLREETRQMLSNLRVIPGVALRSRGHFPIYDEIRAELCRLPIAQGAFPTFISHRWESKAEPDPDNYQFETISSAIQDDAFYWYDYSCVPQRIRTDGDREDLEGILTNLNRIVRTSKIIILRRTQDDYFTRGWCFHEWFTAQYTGMFDRTFLSIEPEYSSVHSRQIVDAKRQADWLLCGDLDLLDTLAFTKIEDRGVVTNSIRSTVHRCQRQISETCLEVLSDVAARGPGRSYASLTARDIHERFPRLVLFVKTWIKVLQPVEPVTDRLAMFFHRPHWEALIELSKSIATDLASLEYSVNLRPQETSLVDRDLRNIYDLCQMRVPAPRYAVVAFLCFFLMGYELR